MCMPSLCLWFGNTAPHSVNPNQLPVAPTNAACGLAGLGVLGVETVDTCGAGRQACICGASNTAPCSVNPNQLPVALTNAACGLAGLGVLGVRTVDTRGVLAIRGALPVMQCDGVKEGAGVRLG